MLTPEQQSEIDAGVVPDPGMEQPETAPEAEPIPEPEPEPEPAPDFQTDEFSQDTSTFDNGTNEQNF
jgi:hypothetical protein